jgi:hypothetical protein
MVEFTTEQRTPRVGCDRNPSGRIASVHLTNVTVATIITAALGDDFITRCMASSLFVDR